MGSKLPATLGTWRDIAVGVLDSFIEVARESQSLDHSDVLTCTSTTSALWAMLFNFLRTHHMLQKVSSARSTARSPANAQFVSCELCLESKRSNIHD